MKLKKNFQLYQPSGYLNCADILDKIPVPFVFITGGRGTGKTYGFLSEMILRNQKFIYMRRTQTEIDEIFNEQLSPFKSINRDFGWNIQPFRISKSISGFWQATYDEKGKMVPMGDCLGIILALSTVANIRGFDASDCSSMIYDEFIPEEHKRAMRGEDAAFFNAYETINRNRELQGKEPLRCICLSNANNLANPLFIGLKIVNKIYNMRASGQEVYIDSKRGMCVICLDKSDISELKAETSLYRLTYGTAFYAMSIDNDFENPTVAPHKPQNLKEYVPTVVLGEACIYEHKSEGKMYVSSHVSGNPIVLGTTGTDRLKAKRFFNYIWIAYLNQQVIFETIQLEVYLQRYFKNEM